MLPIYLALAVDAIHAIQWILIALRPNMSKCFRYYAVAVVSSIRHVYLALAQDAILAIQVLIAQTCDAHPAVAVTASLCSRYL